MNEYKQYCKLVCQEANVKEFSLYVCSTEKGEMKLNYILEDDHFNFTVGEKVYWSDNLEKLALKALDKFFNK